MERVRGYLRDGIPEGQYRYDILTGEILTARKKALTTAEAAVCAAVAAAAGLAFVTLVKRSYRLKGSTYSYNFRENCDLTITGRVDDYIRTTTTQARKPDRRAPPGAGDTTAAAAVCTPVSAAAITAVAAAISEAMRPDRKTVDSLRRGAHALARGVHGGWRRCF